MVGGQTYRRDSVIAVGKLAVQNGRDQHLAQLTDVLALLYLN